MPALAYFNDLSESEQVSVLVLFERIGIFGRITDKTKFRKERDEIWAFKPQPHRFLCFFVKGKRIVVTNAFHKKTDKLPAKELQLALRRKADYEERIKKKDYYPADDLWPPDEIP
ncbi:MAG: type II toxin-antitoxin system RelE/ParE family toxin [Leptospiraceae bacterium]|nr:type II toxin-antitoxin system RelE/ParE family toxin [Leptospiraceae bacterium]